MVYFFQKARKEINNRGILHSSPALVKQTNKRHRPTQVHCGPSPILLTLDAQCYQNSQTKQNRDQTRHLTS